MKVLHLIKSLGRGGAEMLLQETLKLHNKEKFEFHYIYFLPWKDQMVPGLVAEGGIVTNIPAAGNIKIMLKTGEVIRYIKKHKIDLVHCHLPWAGFAGRLIHKRTGIPVIYSEHNKQERYHTATRTVNRLTFNMQTKVIAVSADVEESIRKWIKPSIPVITILNAVNTDNFIRNPQSGLEIRKQYGIDEGAILIGTIAVFRFQKRLKEWIDVFASLHRKHPGIRGCIVGDGLLKDEIMQYLASKGMQDYIIFPGLQTNVLPWLSAMDIFMMSSEFEGLPIALLEAMSMGCAVVCTDAGGIKEVIRDGESGFLVPVDQWRDLETKLELLVSHPEQIHLYGQKARERVQDAFSMKAMVEQIEQVYSSNM